MNAKAAKKLRWYARAQEAGYPDPVINHDGIPSTLLVYNHPKTFKDKDGVERTFVNRTVQYNPRTSGKGFYRALKKADVRLRGDLVKVRGQCQYRAIQMYTARSERDRAAAEAAAAIAPGSLERPSSEMALSGNDVSGQRVADVL